MHGSCSNFQCSIYGTVRITIRGLRPCVDVCQWCLRMARGLALRSACPLPSSEMKFEKARWNRSKTSFLPVANSRRSKHSCLTLWAHISEKWLDITARYETDSKGPVTVGNLHIAAFRSGEKTGMFEIFFVVISSHPFTTPKTFRDKPFEII